MLSAGEVETAFLTLLERLEQSPRPDELADPFRALSRLARELISVLGAEVDEFDPSLLAGIRGKVSGRVYKLACSLRTEVVRAASRESFTSYRDREIPIRVSHLAMEAVDFDWELKAATGRAIRLIEGVREWCVRLSALGISVRESAPVLIKDPIKCGKPGRRTDYPEEIVESAKAMLEGREGKVKYAEILVDLRHKHSTSEYAQEMTESTVKKIADMLRQRRKRPPTKKRRTVR